APPSPSFPYTTLFRSSAPFDRGRPGQRPDHLLGAGIEREARGVRAKRRPGAEVDHAALAGHERRVRRLHAPQRAEEAAVPGAPRSEEHTSELQSRSDL